MMKKIEGYIFKTGSTNKNGHVYSKECKINFAEKIPIALGFDFGIPGKIVGNGSIVQKEDELYIEGEIIDSVFENDFITHMGLYATNVKMKDDVITEMNIRAVALLQEYEAAMPECIIIRDKGDEYD